MRSLLLLLLVLPISAYSVFAENLKLVDAYPDKARYAPFEPVNLFIELDGKATGSEKILASITQLGQVVSNCGPVSLKPDASGTITVPCKVPSDDYQGYLVTVRLTDAIGRNLSERQTALDISSDWKRFPRYGYLAHYNASEGTDPKQWLTDLNEFHINGLEFYDFQYRHDKPLAGTVQHPKASWKDIAGRIVDGAMVRELIDEAHHYNMMAMAYNASYSAYDDVFSRSKDRFPLEWAIWDTHDGPRTAATAKNLELQNTSGWSTHRLYYMNQNCTAWQGYLFAQMHDLFEVYPFDGWHVDTFGEQGGYAFDGSRVDYITGFRSFIDHASADLHKRILFNAVGTLGQESIAQSAADFVYSELWDDNETFDGILLATEQVHFANPRMGYVIAAYLHKEPEHGPVATAKQFNMPSVLLTDAAIFASGAAHIELGDGDRMLSREYFPADTRISVSPALHDALRHYYDFLTAYENYLRDDMEIHPCGVRFAITGYTTNPLAVPNTIWTITRRKNNVTVLHLINLLGSDDPHWRDVQMTRPIPPTLHELKVDVALPGDIQSVGWASPDVDGGQFHLLPFKLVGQKDTNQLEFTVPSLRYWDTVFITTR